MILLRSLAISRFRGIREGNIQGLTDVNLLIGRNNSGKTTVIEAILRLLGTHGQSTDLLRRALPQVCSQIRQDSGQIDREAWYKQDLTQPLLLEAKVGESTAPNSSRDLALALRMTADRGEPQGEPSAQEEPNGISKNQAAGLLRAVTLLRPADAGNRNIETQLWPQLLEKRRDKLLTRTLNDIFSLNAESVALLPDNRLMVLFDDHSLPLDVQGDGTRAAMRTIMVLTMMKNSLLMLEEPECHQHPGSLERFARAICKLAREQEVQLIISTHSAECVRSFLKAAGEAGSEAAVFHLSLTNGKQEARRLDLEAVETLQATGVDVRFLDLYA